MLANFALIENLDSVFDKTTGNFVLSFKNDGYKFKSGTEEETSLINKTLTVLKTKNENMFYQYRNKIKNRNILKGLDNGFFG